MKNKGKSLNKSNWDILRNDSQNSPFAFEHTIKEYEDNCASSLFYRKSAKIMDNSIKKLGWDRETIVSFGCGKGILEWNLKRINKSYDIICTDFAEDSIKRLKDLFIKAKECLVFDMLNDNYDIFKKDSIAIFFRVSTEFSKDEWISIFGKLYKDGIDKIIYVPTELATFGIQFKERITHLKNILRRKKETFCGWLYSEKEFLEFFYGKSNAFRQYQVVERIPYKGTAIFFLKRRHNSLEFAYK